MKWQEIEIIIQCGILFLLRPRASVPSTLVLLYSSASSTTIVLFNVNVCSIDISEFVHHFNLYIDVMYSFRLLRYTLRHDTVLLLFYAFRAALSLCALYKNGNKKNSSLFILLLENSLKRAHNQHMILCSSISSTTS